MTPGIIDVLREQVRRWYDDRSGEIYLTDAINSYAGTRAVYGQVLTGAWYDTGNHTDYLIAQFASAITDPEHGPALRKFLSATSFTTATQIPSVATQSSAAETSPLSLVDRIAI
ncbi:hypothetical protein [Mycobacterium sp. 141]|uniref:hypothetical protein n=1 Tax=Mycobacterium sp. 141 TaxID=1120797 RepID=UPI00037004AA|nr:hypothetical protein [Mycobacterium sp. 141]